jgi:hypothetical protein
MGVGTSALRNVRFVQKTLDGVTSATEVLNCKLKGVDWTTLVRNWVSCGTLKDTRLDFVFHKGRTFLNQLRYY